MKANSMKFLGAALAVAAAAAAAGCGEVSRQGRSPVQVVVSTIEGASGAAPNEFSGTLNSDVVTMVERTINGQQVRVSTIYNDSGRATFRLLLKDPGTTESPASPSGLNQVTFTRYRVTYRRSDGRNTPGLDVPYPFDSAITVTVAGTTNASVGFELVRHTAKEEAPLVALGSSPSIIYTVAEVTFYGRDQAGNEVTASGSLGVAFGNFADPS